MIIRNLILIATFYSQKFEGRKTFSAEVFSQNKYTAATRMFKQGTKLKITNTVNCKEVIVVVNDKCKKLNVIDLSKSAFLQLSPLEKGFIHVKCEKIN